MFTIELCCLSSGSGEDHTSAGQLTSVSEAERQTAGVLADRACTRSIVWTPLEHQHFQCAESSSCPHGRNGASRSLLKREASTVRPSRGSDLHFLNISRAWI